MGEPLGRSQVLSYLTRLAGRYEITLISFEKPGDGRRELAAELAEAGIRWVPLAYHRRPPVISTARDVLAGRRALLRELRRDSVAIVHVRSYVPALIATAAGVRGRSRLLFDIRGFWADERVEGGLWKDGSLLYRIAKRCERRFFAEADAIVTLTEASVPKVRDLAGHRSVPVAVIPTCVDLDRFVQRPPRHDGAHAVWVGSIGTWYRFDLTAKVARALGLPLTVLTRETELARRVLDGYDADVRSAAPQKVASELCAGDVGLCLISSSPSKVASAPTRFAEYLAAGMPVIVTPGVGDLESIVTEEQIGVVLRGEDDQSIADAAATVTKLASDRGVWQRCRQVAEERFDVQAGAADYAELYRLLCDRVV
jgi:glycosyltransferase involved in cell wall biosynthesis